MTSQSFTYNLARYLQDLIPLVLQAGLINKPSKYSLAATERFKKKVESFECCDSRKLGCLLRIVHVLNRIETVKYSLITFAIKCYIEYK